MRSMTRHAPTAARLLLGLLFFVFGLDGFLGVLPHPTPTAAGGAFLGALAATGYVFPLIKGTEIVSGALLLAHRHVPLALTLLAPIVVNILAFHAVLSPPGTGAGLVALGLGLYLAWVHRGAFEPMLAAKPHPEGTASEGPGAPLRPVSGHA